MPWSPNLLRCFCPNLFAFIDAVRVVFPPPIVNREETAMFWTPSLFRRCCPDPTAFIDVVRVASDGYPPVCLQNPGPFEELSANTYLCLEQCCNEAIGSSKEASAALLRQFCTIACGYARACAFPQTEAGAERAYELVRELMQTVGLEPQTEPHSGYVREKFCCYFPQASTTELANLVSQGFCVARNEQGWV